MNHTWRDVAVIVPDFVQWIVQKHGPLPEGQVDIELYAHYLAEYVRERG